MNDPAAHPTEDLFAFPIETAGGPGAEASGLVYADDQDPRAFTEAGVVADRVAALVERAYVGERMAASVHYLKWGQLWHDTHDAYLRHDGAAELLVFVRRAVPAPSLPRGAARLDRIAARILLGRARARLAVDPADTEAEIVIEAMLGELGRTA